MIFLAVAFNQHYIFYIICVVTEDIVDSFFFLLETRGHAGSKKSR